MACGIDSEPRNAPKSSPRPIFQGVRTPVDGRHLALDPAHADLPLILPRTIAGCPGRAMLPAAVLWDLAIRDVDTILPPTRMEAVVHIHVIHENAAWLEPLAKALDSQRLLWRDWFLDRGVFDLSRPPPEGVFYNRMSASSHTRDHRYAAELTAAVLAWLVRHGRRVVNGPRALDLEISKARQYAGCA